MIEVLIGIVILFILLKVLLNKPTAESYYTPYMVFNEYKEFYSNQLESKKVSIEEEGFKVVLDTVIDGDYELLEFKDIEGLPYSPKKISKIIREDYLNKIEDKDRELTLLYGLSYLYKPKDKYKQRMFDGRVLRQFSECNGRKGSDIRDVSKLPYPREVILDSFCREYPLEEDDEKYRNSMKIMVMELGDYQEGVGVEDLSMMGFDGKRFSDELNKFPKEKQPELFMDKLENKNTGEQRNKYKSFKKSCDRDKESFYNKMITSEVKKDETNE